MGLFMKREGKQKETSDSQFDIWKIWRKTATILFKERISQANEQPLLDNNCIVVIVWKTFSSPSIISDREVRSFFSTHGFFPQYYETHGFFAKDYQSDLVVNMLYYATVRNKYGIRLLCEDEGDICLPFEKLSEYSVMIHFLSDVLGYHANDITVQEFVNKSRNLVVYSSTPYGDLVGGGSKMFLLCKAEDDDTHYLPVFVSLEHMKEFYKDRNGYLIVEETLKDFLEGHDPDLFKKAFNKYHGPSLPRLGALLEPGHCNVEIPPGIRCQDV